MLEVEKVPTPLTRLAQKAYELNRTLKERFNPLYARANRSETLAARAAASIVRDPVHTK